MTAKKMFGMGYRFDLIHRDHGSTPELMKDEIDEQRRKRNHLRVAKAAPGLTSKDVRHRNFLALISHYGSITAMAAALDITANYLSQLKNRTREIGDATARRIEDAAGRDRGWMDHRESSEIVDDKPLPQMLSRRVPRLTWHQAAPYPAVAEALAAGGMRMVLAIEEPPMGPYVYALGVDGDAMVSPADSLPTFANGCTIIVDPQLPLEHGRFVVVRLNGALTATFRQYRVDGDRAYLVPLNKRYPIVEIVGPMLYCGQVVSIAEWRDERDPQ